MQEVLLGGSRLNIFKEGSVPGFVNSKFVF